MLVYWTWGFISSTLLIYWLCYIDSTQLIYCLWYFINLTLLMYWSWCFIDWYLGWWDGRGCLSATTRKTDEWIFAIFMKCRIWHKEQSKRFRWILYFWPLWVVNLMGWMHVQSLFCSINLRRRSILSIYLWLYISWIHHTHSCYMNIHSYTDVSDKSFIWKWIYDCSISFVHTAQECICTARWSYG